MDRILIPRPGANEYPIYENSQLRRKSRQGNSQKNRAYVLNEALRPDVKKVKYNLQEIDNSEESYGTLKEFNKKYLLVKLKPRKTEYNNKYINLEDLVNRPDRKIQLKKTIKKAQTLQDVFANAYSLQKNKKQKNKLNEHNKRYESLFDDNGMIYLSNPQQDEDRKLNKLMNKLVKYEAIDKKDRYLRKPVSEVFTNDELKRWDKIVRAFSGDDGPAAPRTEFDFSELVL